MDLSSISERRGVGKLWCEGEVTTLFSIGDYKVNFDLDLETDEELNKEDSILKYEELLGKKPKETKET